MASQFASPELFERQRHDALKSLLAYAAGTNAFYARHLAPVITSSGDIDVAGWEAIEPMGRPSLDAAQGILSNSEIPASHGSTRVVLTSGSTSRPLRVPRTVMSDTADKAASLRFHAWHGIDFARDLAQVRALAIEPRRRQGVHVDTERWGEPWMPATERGRIRQLSVFAPLRQQLDWLASFDRPAYLNTFPSNLVALSDYLEATGADAPALAGVLSVGEAVNGDVRTLCARHWPEIVDLYSTAECGGVAGQCPDGDCSHVFAEVCLVEILDDNGRPCRIGEQGWLTVTPFYNYALPLFRYQPGDRGAWAPPCGCGRTLPALMPEVSRPRYAIELGIDAHWHAPAALHRALCDTLPGCRWRIVQTGKRALELVYMRPATAGDIDVPGAIRAVRARATKRAKVEARETGVLGPGPGGKFSRLLNEVWGP